MEKIFSLTFRWINYWCPFQVRNTDEQDPFREKTVQLLDDFKISGVNGTRILKNVKQCVLQIRSFKSSTYFETLSVIYFCDEYVI